MPTLRRHLLFVLLTLLAATSTAISAKPGFEEALAGSFLRPRVCHGTLAECLTAAEGGEYELDPVVVRRLMPTSTYISYGALRRDSVPCSVRGASYYNCRPGANANPYSRGCSAITKCRS